MGLLTSPWTAACATGLLLTAGFPLWHYAPAGWIALVPLLVHVAKLSLGTAFSLGFLAGFIHHLTTLSWITYVVTHYGNLPLTVAAAVLCLLCAYLALYPAIFFAVAQRWQGSQGLAIWGLPCLWIALEWGRAHLLTGFPWTNVGYTQTTVTPLVQTADLAGVYGVGWLVVLGNTVLARLVKGRVGLRHVCAAALCAALFVAYGLWREKSFENPHQNAAHPLHVALIQGNIDQSVKWDPEYQEATLNIYWNLSQAALEEKPVDLLVWPETAAPFFYGYEDTPTRRLHDIAASVQVPILLGIPWVIPDGASPRLQNRAVLLHHDQGIVAFYAKRHLVPFGEYVPLKRVLFFVEKLVAAAGDFVPGRGPSVFPFKDTFLGLLICYEAIFPELARDAVRHGARVLVNLTNDAWFGRTAAPYQHLDIARWRAVENRVPLVRCANTGISAIFDPTGKTLTSLPLNVAATTKATVFVGSNTPSFYVRYGDVFAWGCTLTALLCVVYGEQARRRRLFKNPSCHFLGKPPSGMVWFKKKMPL
ncbi:apolipoprotein N-acyltransferase [Desulfosoma caldarium]|uniref:Apolipoprotein N-acyltransferase n=1 Tax=Desulfosoma caldarium TaxID=610254 RepID=A0A3N1UN05_9BACT|nr:apolipoprotein N-acyltransferase [Desulfosoma caldarium]ROQ91118.1 apolipoprotein N-acyltransferase [Desulfosoma caldarium]